MSYYRADPSRPDKAKAVAGVIIVYLLLGSLLLLARRDPPQPVDDAVPTVLINVDPPAPQPPAERSADRAARPEGAAGRKGQPTPVVAPKPVMPLPTPSPVIAAPVAGARTAPTAGNAATGSGPGAGGSGGGPGGGGGGDGDGIGSEARLLGGNSARLPASLLRGFAADRGYGHLLLSLSPQGRVTDCDVLTSTGDPAVDQALCQLMIRRSRWSPALDRSGRPIPVRVRYTATWRK